MTLMKENLKQQMKQSLGGSIGSTPVKQSIFDASVSHEPPKNDQAKNDLEPKLSLEENKEKTTKAEVFTERVTLVISSTQRDRIEALAKSIQRNGKKKPERITSNSVLRCLIDLLENFDADIGSITTEDDLKSLLTNHFSKSSSR